VNRIVTGQDALIGPWVAERAHTLYIPGWTPTIGLLAPDGSIRAGILFNEYNKANVMIHVASEGKYWLSRKLLWFTFWYVFEQLGCRRASGCCVSNNHASHNLLLHIGFVFEAALKDAHPDGDLLLFRLRKEDCRWLNLRERRHVYSDKTYATAPSGCAASNKRPGSTSGS
jgi:hypothetical protein